MNKKAIMMVILSVVALQGAIAQDPTFHGRYGDWVLFYNDMAAGQPPFEHGGRYWMLVGVGVGQSTDSSGSNTYPYITILHDEQSESLRCIITWHEAFIGSEIEAQFDNGEVMHFSALSGSELFSGTRSLDELSESIYYSQFVSAELFIEKLLELGDSERFVLRGNTTVPFFSQRSESPDMTSSAVMEAAWSSNGFKKAFKIYLENTSNWLSETDQ